MSHTAAVVGFGGMGHGHHANFINAKPYMNLSGIYDIDESKTEEAKKLGFHTYSSLDELLNDRSVDLVTVATPNDSHKEICIKAMNAGKNVVCEKPVTLSVKDFDDMTDAAKKNNVIFTVHQNRRWDPDFMMVKDLYHNKDIGNIFNIESRVHGSRGIPGDWRGMKAHGGGMLYDWGVHLIDQALFMTDGLKLSEISCTLTNLTNKEVDDGFFADLIFENGLRYHIELGTYNFISLPRFYVLGEMGSAEIKHWGSDCDVARCKEWHESHITPVAASNGLTKTMAPRNEITTETYTIKSPDILYDAFYQNVWDAIDGKCGQFIKHEQLRRVLRVIEICFESNEKQQIIKVNL